MPTTVRTPKPDGGYRDVTRNDDGKIIREVDYDVNENIVKRTENDPDSNFSEVTSYEENGEVVIKRFDGPVFLGGKRFDKNKRVVERTTKKADGTEQREEYNYDDAGRIIKVTVIGQDTSILEVIEFEYDGEGRLIRMWSTPTSAGGSCSVELPENREVSTRPGEEAELLAYAQELLAHEYYPPNTHRSVDKASHLVTVTHNPDGSFDVLVFNRQGRPVLAQYYSAGRCYVGDDCPFRRAAPM